MERASQLTAPLQEEIAKLVEEALAHITQPGSQLSPDWRVSVERAMREQAETLEYLKDKGNRKERKT